jgi:diguanylate cyclase (GGDEF)-like protein
MPLRRSHLRRFALLCLLCPSCILLADHAPRLAIHPYHATTFRSDGDITCRYRLDGLQTAFTRTKQPEAHYSSLPPGKYTFQVSCDSPEVGETISGMDSFTVAAPWWQRWLAEIAGMVGVVMLLWGILWKRHRDQHENERLEKAVAERSVELARANVELQEASLCDPLTGLRNRRFFHSMIAADASQAVRAHRGSEIYSRDHRDLIFFLVDIDHFKAVNDEYGHDAGDRVLVEIGHRLNRVVRESDFLIRWGGEEFLVVFRSADRNEGELLASRILKAVNSTEFDLGSNRRLTKSCSVGWAAFPWLPPSLSTLSVDEVLRLADRGLYTAKQHGRNQAIGVIPTTYSPVIAVQSEENSSGNVVTRPDKFSCIEQLVEAKMIREVCTHGAVAKAAAG